jgi:hypothetical protein
LEKILHVHLAAVDQIISKLQKKVLFAMGHPMAAATFLRQGSGPIDQEIRFASIQVSQIIKRLRAKTYLLAHDGEAEAMGQALGKVMRSNPKTKPQRDKEAPSGGQLEDRIDLYFSRLGRKIQDAMQRAKIMGEDPRERVKKAFPPTRSIKSTPALTRRKTAKESDPLLSKSLTSDDPRAEMSVGITDDDMWNEILKDYTANVLPEDIFKRGGEDKTLFYDVTTGETEERYTWEVEQEITEDFVRGVREGSNDAAKENGYDDFMWITIQDSKTDECCSCRDRLSSSQIEEMLDSGKIDADECDAIVPPAHFNCRCSSAPMTTAEQEFDPKELESFYSDVNDWLDMKANGG